MANFLEKTNVLLVNDREEQLLTLESILAPLEQVVLVKARSGHEALRLLLKQNFSVILLDVKMPIMNGFETAALIRQRKENEITPIVFMSAAQYSSTDQFAGYSLGAIDYISLPIDPEILRAKVRSLIDLYQKTLQVRSQAESLKIINENLREEIVKRENVERSLQLKNIELEKEIRHRTRIEATKNKLEESAFHHKHYLELAELERIHSMGELASALAHEINQPLAAVTTYIQTCIRQLHIKKYPRTEILDVMKLAAQQAERAGTIIHHIKNFIRKGELLMQVLSINELIHQLIPLIDYETRDNAIQVTFELADSLPLVNVDKIQIEQVILNLIRNAAEAMRDAKTPEPQILLRTMQQDNKIIVSVTDNGPGVADNDISNIFNPHVSTKASGMGMGLAISHTIIAAHQGQLTAVPTKNGGACFQFTLPVVNEVTHEKK